MRTKLTKIGDSNGAIIPAKFLKECQFDDTVSIKLHDNTVVISKYDQPRSGWREAFASVSPNEDALLINDTLINDFDDTEWSWKNVSISVTF